jgi:glycosyltransferase involved in cell wall biosynthesis
MQQITEPYLLSVCVPIKTDAKGVRWCDDLWAKDLALHLDYIEKLTLACPRVFEEATERDVPLNQSPFNRLKYVDLPNPRNRFSALASLLETTTKMWTAVQKNKIIHTGFGGWPMPEGWFAVPIGRAQGKFVITNVESSPWRVDAQHAHWSRRLRAKFVEFANRQCVRMANLRLFTSAGYRAEFLGSNSTRAYVNPATWIDEDVIITNDEAEAIWAKKNGDTRLIFVGRLTEAKGLAVLLRVIDSASNLSGVSISILGEGPLRTACEELARRANVQFSLLGEVRYGPEFFGLLRQFDAVVVPSISDEQPRIIFDAFSQAVPIIGSDTGGIRQVVDHEENGVLFRAGDANELERRLRWAGSHRNDLRKMGLAGLNKSRGFTHRTMHEARSSIIAAEFERQSRK